MNEGIEANAPMMKTTGTLDDPIVVNSAGDEQLAGCTGYPADSHVTLWLGVRLPPLPPPTHNPQPYPFCLRQNRTPPLHPPHHKLLADPPPNRCPAPAPSHAAANAAASTAWSTSGRPTTRTRTTGTARSTATPRTITKSRRRLRITCGRSIEARRSRITKSREGARGERRAAQGWARRGCTYYRLRRTRVVDQEQFELLAFERP